MGDLTKNYSSLLWWLEVQDRAAGRVGSLEASVLAVQMFLSLLCLYMAFSLCASIPGVPSPYQSTSPTRSGPYPDDLT